MVIAEFWPVLHIAANERPLHLLLVKRRQSRELNPFLHYIWPPRFINHGPPASHGNNEDWTLARAWVFFLSETDALFGPHSISFSSVLRVFLVTFQQGLLLA